MRHGFIWYVIITAIQKGIDPVKIHYIVKNHRVSPLIEYMPEFLRHFDRPDPVEEELASVDINPFWRLAFNEIYNKIVVSDRNDPNDAVFCDLITHVLADTDRVSCMCKRDFQILLIMNDISAGCFGGKEVADSFSIFEKRAIAEALIMLYKTLDSLLSLTSLFSMIMTDTVIRDRDCIEVVFYNPNEFNITEDHKLRFIINLFLPINYLYAVHWKYTYGVVEHEESILLEQFVL